MSIAAKHMELLHDIAQRDRDAYLVLGAMLDKYAVTPEEIAALGLARGLLNADARDSDWQAHAIQKDVDQGVRA